MKRLALALTVAAVVAVAGAPSSARAGVGVAFFCSPAPVDCSGWYRQNVTVHWSVNPPPPATTILSGCAQQTLTTDTAGTWVWCSATDGTTKTDVSTKIKVDKTPPTVTGAQPARPADANGWYRAAVNVSFRGTDATSGLRSCTSTTYGGPDGAASVAGTCVDNAGNTSAPLRFPLHYDATAPVIAGARPSRAPDYRGWYNHPVTWSVQASDATSGIDDCPPVLVANVAASAAEPFTTVCRDRAGNVASRGFAFAYDATPPAKPNVKVHLRDREVRLSVKASPDTVGLTIDRSPGRHGHKDSRLYRGRPASFTDRHVTNNRSYRYTITAVDQAGNVSRRHVKARPRPHLKAPARAALVPAPPRLSWTAVRHARYYNVQLFRNGHKVLSAWPTRPHLQLKARWRFAGKIRQLRAGEYSWFVWPGFGPRSSRRFGELIGSRTFTVAG